MPRFVARRLVASVPVVVAASFVVFSLVALSGDPLVRIKSRPHVDTAQVELWTTRLHLDRPIPVRWAIWAKGLVHGDLGQSYHQRPVGTALKRAFPVTLRIIFVALALALLMTLLIGAISAARQYSVFDHVGTVTAFVLLSIPAFWLAGIVRRVVDPARWGLDADLTLPALTLALLVMADWSRFLRAGMLDAIGSDYVRTARAKGLSEVRVVGHHALRNALIPLVTVMALSFADLLGGAIVIEQVFGIRGAGYALLHGLSEYDVNMVSGWLLVAAVAVVTANLAADVAYGLLDPRVRVGRAG